MIAIRQLTAAAIVSVALAACGQEDRTTPTKGYSNTLLHHVPADTPYVAANLERLPEDVVDVYLQRMQPAIDEMQTQLSLARSELETDSSGAPGVDDRGARLTLAILQELDGKLSRGGLRELGLDIPAHKVVYGLGAFPVMRIGLADPELLKTTVRRVLDNADIDAPEQTHRGVDFWRLDAEGEGSPIALYVSILSNHLAIGLLPTAAEAELLPVFLGIELPAGSDAGARLAELNRSQDYTPYGSGILDLHRLADEFLRPDATAARMVAGLGDYDPASLSAECVNEIHAIIDHVPQITLGTSEFSVEAIAYRYRFLSAAPLASQLAALVARVPMADPGSERVFDFSFGMRFGAVRDFLRDEATAVVADPYRCEHLQELNSSAEQLLAQLDQPMPPFINNFRGLRVSLNSVSFGGEQLPNDARGHLALHVEQPEMFVGMAKMFLPDLAELPITPGGEPIRLPESMIPVPDVVAYAAMSDDAIGLSVGPGEESLLPDFLTRDPGPEGMFLSASYDMAAYIDQTARFNPAHHYDGSDAHGVHAVTEAAREAFREMADRGAMTLRFGQEGLEIDGRVTFRPQDPSIASDP